MGERHANLSLDHLAAFAEFEDDPDTVKELARCAKDDPDYFEHFLSEKRQERERKQAFDLAVETLEAANVRVVDDPGYSGRSAMRRLSSLRDGTGEELAEESHASCPGHVASISPYRRAEITFWCEEPSKYGHVEPGRRGASSVEKGPDGHLTAEAKAERRKVIANNKAMDAAIPVRRQFVQRLVARKTAPKGALRFVAEDLAANPSAAGHPDEDLLAAFLQIEPPKERYYGSHDVAVGAVADATDARLPVVLLAQLASSIEAVWTKETWRTTSKRNAAWLSFLASEGYTLAEIEQLVIDTAASVTERRYRIGGGVDEFPPGEDDDPDDFGDDADAQEALDDDAVAIAVAELVTR